MEAKDKKVITEYILCKFAGTDPEMDIDWDMMEISFQAGQQDVCTVPVSKFIEQGRRDVVEFISDLIIGIDGCTFEERLDVTRAALSWI